MANRIFKVMGTVQGYDTYSSFVCISPDAEHARRTHPNEWRGITWDDGQWVEAGVPAWESSWDQSIETVTVVEIGIAHPDAEIGVVCSAFHAG